MTTRTAIASVAITALLLAATAACGSTTGGGYANTSAGGTGGSSGGSSGGTSGGDNGNGGQALTGGTTGGQHGGADNQCEFTFSPMPSGIIPGASVKGTVFTKCATPPRAHVLNLYLQFSSDNASWADRNNKSIDKIPGPAITPNLITAPCVPGWWRVVVSIDGTSASGIDWHVQETTSEPREVKPSECG